MHPAEIALRQDINGLDMYRPAPRMLDIRRDIKYAFWHGFINEKIYNELNKLLSDKYNSLFE